jgi:hypothetical protein
MTGPEVLLRMSVKSAPGGDAFAVSRELRLRCHEALVAGGVRAGTGREIAITGVPSDPQEKP